MDRSSQSEPVLTACAELAMKFGAKLHLLYMVPTANTVTPEEVPAGQLFPQTTRLLLDMETEEIHAHLQEQLESLLVRNIDASGGVERGEALPASFRRLCPERGGPGRHGHQGTGRPRGALGKGPRCENIG